jgi:outer membrane autotransporter protein
LGFDRCCCNWILGGASGYTHSTFNWYQQCTGKGRIDSFYASIYTSYNPKRFAVDFSLIGGGSDHHISRKIPLPGLHRDANSDLWGYFLTAHAGGRGTWKCGCFALEGFALTDYHYFIREAFSESGAHSLNLTAFQHTQHFMRGEAGLRAYYSSVCYYYCFAPYIGASWVGDFPLNTSVQKAHFSGRNYAMDIDIYHASIEMVSPEIGVRLTYDCGPTMLIGYKGLFGKKVRMNQADVRFEWAF